MVRKLILVTGATGKQGGSLIRSLLDHGGYEIRALSRNVDSEPAKALSGQGIQVVLGEMTDQTSLLTACQGVYAVFGVSIPELWCGVSELEQGKNLVDACKANDVSVLVWSSLTSCRDTTNGRYDVPGFDQKADVERYIAAERQAAIVFRTGGFTSNLMHNKQLKRDETDPSRYHIQYPFVPGSSPQPWSYVEKDVGPVVLAAIEKWEDPVWRKELTAGPIPLVSYQATGDELAKIISKASGKEVDWVMTTPDNLHIQLSEMFKWCAEQRWGYGDKIPVPIIDKLGVRMHTFEDYIQESVLPWMNAQD